MGGTRVRRATLWQRVILVALSGVVSACSATSSRTFLYPDVRSPTAVSGDTFSEYGYSADNAPGVYTVDFQLASGRPVRLTAAVPPNSLDSLDVVAQLASRRSFEDIEIGCSANLPALRASREGWSLSLQLTADSDLVDSETGCHLSRPQRADLSAALESLRFETLQEWLALARSSNEVADVGSSD